MADKEYWVGSVGPLYYDDADDYPDGEPMRGARYPQIHLEDEAIEDTHAVRKEDMDVAIAAIGPTGGWMPAGWLPKGWFP